MYHGANNLVDSKSTIEREAELKKRLRGTIVLASASSCKAPPPKSATVETNAGMESEKTLSTTTNDNTQTHETSRALTASDIDQLISEEMDKALSTRTRESSLESGEISTDSEEAIIITEAKPKAPAPAKPASIHPCVPPFTTGFGTVVPRSGAPFFSATVLKRFNQMQPNGNGRGSQPNKPRPTYPSLERSIRSIPAQPLSVPPYTKLPRPDLRGTGNGTPSNPSGQTSPTPLASKSSSGGPPAQRSNPSKVNEARQLSRELPKPSGHIICGKSSVKEANHQAAAAIVPGLKRERKVLSETSSNSKGYMTVLSGPAEPPSSACLGIQERLPHDTGEGSVTEGQLNFVDYKCIPEWLAATGFHDREYRNKKLELYRAQQHIPRLHKENEQSRIKTAVNPRGMRTTTKASTLDSPNDHVHAVTTSTRSSTKRDISPSEHDRCNGRNRKRGKIDNAVGQARGRRNKRLER